MILDLLQAGTALKNPHSAMISSITSLTGSIESNLQNAPGWEPADITEFMTHASNIPTTMSSFLSHTNKLSGVDISSGYNMSNIFSIAKTAKGILKAPGCDSILNMFKSLTGGAVLLYALYEFLTHLDKYLPAAAILLLNGYLNDIEQMILHDLNAYANALQLAILNGISDGLLGLLGDNCFAGIVGAIATDKLKSRLIGEISSGRAKANSAVRSVLSKRL